MLKKKVSSIAGKITLPFSVCFLVLVLLFAVIGYFYLNESIVEQEKSLLCSVAQTFKRQLEIDTDKLEGSEEEREKEFIDIFNFSAIGICQYYNVDYVSIYKPIFEKNLVEYSSIVRNKNLRGTAGIDADVYGKDNRQTMNFEKGDYKVWKDEAELSFIHNEDAYTNELCVIVKVYDSSGNPYLVSIESSYKDMRIIVINKFIVLVLLLLLIFSIMNSALYLVIKYKVSYPAKQVSEAMHDFASNGVRKDIKLEANQNDELGDISRSFNKMADDINNYIQNISTLNEDKERHDAEVNIAANIQKGFLPASDKHYEHCEFDSVMIPARDVGGDMFDYIKLDDDNCFLMIADVAGKGISASLFMAATLTYIRSLARISRDPSFILKSTNDYLSENNPRMIFVTAFACIFNSCDMTLTYSNAGHNYPYIISDNLRRLDEVGGCVLGLFEKEDYQNCVIKLKPGDTIFMYTDGVTEALNDKREFYGEERLERALNEYFDSAETKLIPFVRENVKNFAGDMDQNDDITMLTMVVCNESSLELKGDMSEFAKIKDVILNSEINEEMKLQMCLAAEEIFTNTVSYAFDEMRSEDCRIRFSFNISDKITMKFADNGIKYNPLENAVDVDKSDDEEQEGGLGKFIAFSIADAASYDYVNGENVLTITKIGRLH